jgi:hypothetical protein
VRVPAEAVSGKAKVTLSFSAWKAGDVMAATFAVAIEEAKTAGKERASTEKE